MWYKGPFSLHAAAESRCGCLFKYMGKFPQPIFIYASCCCCKPSQYILTLAGTSHFAPFHSTQGVGTTPRAVSPLIELELRGKKRACSQGRSQDFAAGNP